MLHCRGAGADRSFQGKRRNNITFWQLDIIWHRVYPHDHLQLANDDDFGDMPLLSIIIHWKWDIPNFGLIGPPTEPLAAPNVVPVLLVLRGVGCWSLGVVLVRTPLGVDDHWGTRDGPTGGIHRFPYIPDYPLDFQPL